MRFATLRCSAIIFLVSIFLYGCAHHKTPIILDQNPDRPYEVIQPIEAIVNWGHFQWVWFWWHYAPWYSSVNSIHREALVKKAKQLDADAIINIKYLPHHGGATAEAIRFK